MRLPGEVKMKMDASARGRTSALSKQQFHSWGGALFFGRSAKESVKNFRLVLKVDVMARGAISLTPRLQLGGHGHQ